MVEPNVMTTAAKRRALLGAAVPCAAAILVLAGAAPAAEEVPELRDGIESLYGKVKLQFASWLHAQVSANDKDAAGVETTETASYLEFSLYMKAVADEKHYAMVKLDMEDEDDLIEQLYFALDDVGGSAASVSFGEKQVRFGQWAAIAYNSGLAYGWPGVGGLQFPGWMTDALQFETKIRAHATTDVYFSTLMNPSITGSMNNGGDTTNYSAVRTTPDGDPRDTGFFQSYSMQIDSKPAKGLQAKLSFLNFHDAAKTAAGESADSKAFGIGVTCSIKTWRVFAEYVGTRDWNHTDGFDLSLYEVGVYCDGTEKLGFGVLLDKAEAKGQGAGGADARLTNVMAGFKYKLGRGMESYIEYTFQEEGSADEVLNRVQAGMCWWF